mmetsp:Transcript_63062/g.142268  ORF Transcript_63062/g.142268 Transcript_63062/m.142268 type:complete len:232 (-) Transcript_63062:489-1184(-)|eukprot:CAMPEP_0172600032 /NCGR_PEP_ID=MMETSP1068-20121228/20165_1 /TAXON_ID=35684 /ORGANISM="Pseudopedinella elastica, Strain CCMP716" /LENGTH=231 /DNA_ID=CAMNT_0013400505 /DNA_START=84 /DNA_END=779 /DNA_ORIENTATION=+
MKFRTRSFFWLPVVLACHPRLVYSLLAQRSVWHRASGTHEAHTEGLDAEADAVGPGIYGGRVERDSSGSVVIGKQFEEHNSRPGPVYAGGGYTEMSAAIMAGPEAVAGLLSPSSGLVHEVSTGGATPLHVCCMTDRGQLSAGLLIEAGSELEARDTWGYTALQRAATNNLPVAADALVKAGASHTSPSGLEKTGESARDLARRLRSFSVLKVFQSWERANGIPLPEGEFEL